MAEPSYPIKEQIVQAIVTALEAISLENGYHTDVSSVVRPRRTGENFAPADKGVAVLQDAEYREEDADLCGNPPAIGWRLPISCDLVVRHSEHDETPMDQVLNTFESDVSKCLMADPTWGGLAIDTELGRTEYPAPSAGVEGLTQWVEVIYRVDEDDPYVNRA